MAHNNSLLVWQSSAGTPQPELLPSRSRASFRPSQLRLLRKALQGNDIPTSQRQLLVAILNRVQHAY